MYVTVEMVLRFCCFLCEVRMVRIMRTLMNLRRSRTCKGCEGSLRQRGHVGFPPENVGPISTILNQRCPEPSYSLAVVKALAMYLARNK